MVGRLPDPARAGRLGFAAEGDVIALVGDLRGAASTGSELAQASGRAGGGAAAGRPMQPLSVMRRIRSGSLVNAGALNNAHDVAEGGIAVALAECCIAGGIGASVRLPEGIDPFAEAPGRAFVVSGPEAALDRA